VSIGVDWSNGGGYGAKRDKCLRHEDMVEPRVDVAATTNSTRALLRRYQTQASAELEGCEILPIEALEPCEADLP